MKSLLFKIFLGLCFLVSPVCSYSQIIVEEDAEYYSADAVSEYLYVDVTGNGTVSFQMPAEQNVVSSGGSKHVQLPTQYGTVPGIGVLVTFRVSKDASVSTSDGQTFSVSPGELKQIIIKNLSYPQITVHFNY